MYYSDTPGYQTGQQTSSFMWGVYGWMACALMVTAYVAYGLALLPHYFHLIYSNPIILVGLLVVQLGLVIGLQVALPRLSFATALAMFLLYSATVGVSLATIFFVYTTASIVTTFITAGGMFGVMAAYGYFTRSDLTTIGNLCLMILVGMIISMVVNMFIQSAAFDFVLSGLGVIVFSLLTAYDTQKIKEFASHMAMSRDEMAKITIIGALTLYLDFINLFLFLLRFMGKRRQD